MMAADVLIGYTYDFVDDEKVKEIIREYLKKNSKKIA